MLRLNMDWFSVGDMTVAEAKLCLDTEYKVRKANNQELYHVLYVANANARGGDKNGKPLKLYEDEKKQMSREELKKEMELLGIK